MRLASRPEDRDVATRVLAIRARLIDRAPSRKQIRAAAIKSGGVYFPMLRPSSWIQEAGFGA